MLRFILQALSYSIAGAVPYLMVTRSTHAPFYFSLLAVPLLVLLYLTGPYKAAGICIYATLSEHEKHRFLDKQIVLCKDMRPHLLREYGVRPDKIPAIQEEARLLCGIED
jgi:hypothetical protein